MKKFLIMLAITILAPFVVITNASALTEDEQSVYENFINNYYDSSYPYCYWQSTLFFRCWDDISNIYIDGNNMKFSSPRPIEYFVEFKLSDNEYIIRSTSTNQVGTSARSFDFTRYANFDIYNKSKTEILFNKNIDFSGGIATLYTITFNPPKNTTIEVKDSNNNIIQPESQYIYKLESGSYTYTATNSLYSNLTDIEFTVSSDTTIDVNMEEKLQSQPIKSIFTQYYNYISDLVGKVFDIENPILLFFVSFIIGFSLIILIKRLIGGIF